MIENIGIYFILFLIILNCLAFIFYGFDKLKAKHHSWRIPEKSLLIFSVLGASVGSILGMLVFHHKTKKWYFWFWNFSMLLLWGAGIILYFKNPLLLALINI